MGIKDYADLVRHVDHDIHVVQYGVDQNVAVECLSCMEILMDFDKPEERMFEISVRFITDDENYDAIGLSRYFTMLSSDKDSMLPNGRYEYLKVIGPVT